MIRNKPPKRKMVRTKFNGITYKAKYLKRVKNPGSMPCKWNNTMAFRAMFLAGLGLTEKEIAVALDVHPHSIYYWKRTKPAFLKALQKGKNEYTDRVEKALIESAVGYSHPDTHFTTIDGKVVQTPYIKHYAPNVTAQIFYLKNRARDRWMDVHKIEGQVQHRHLLDLTNLSMKELDILEKIGLTELPEHGGDSD